MREGYYLIGEVSKITGVSKDTLHFYDKIGLLRPDAVDETNRYRYYSRWNLWQLDIITTCRKLSIPLEQVKQILSVHDNNKITEMLLEYRSEALRLSDYYRQVAEDILWYGEENNRLMTGQKSTGVHMEWMKAQTVIAGAPNEDGVSYHANLQAAAKEELLHAHTIRRKYGYSLDLKPARLGRVVKLREYVKIAGEGYSYISTEHLYTIPAGNYAVCMVHIRNEAADFSPLWRFMEENGYTTDAIYADELGLQLFDYLNDYYCEIKAHLVDERR